MYDLYSEYHTKHSDLRPTRSTWTNPDSLCPTKDIPWKLDQDFFFQNFVNWEARSAIGSSWQQSPTSKMATAGKPTSDKAIIYHVIGQGSMRFLASEQVMDIPNLSYNNSRSPRARTAWRCTRILGGRRLTRSKEAGDSTTKHSWDLNVAYIFL